MLLFLSLGAIALISISVGIVGITSIFSSFYLKCLSDFLNQSYVHLILWVSIIVFLSSLIVFFIINYICYLCEEENVNKSIADTYDEEYGPVKKEDNTVK